MATLKAANAKKTSNTATGGAKPANTAANAGKPAGATAPPPTVDPAIQKKADELAKEWNELSKGE